MKHRITAILLSLTLAAPAIAQGQDNADKPASIQEINQAFSNLPIKSREEYAKKILKVQNLFNQKRVFDALEKIDELDKIFPDHPAALNIKGACYVEIRAFDKANAIFGEIIRISPNNHNVLFNQAEVNFVTKNWEVAEKGFTNLLNIVPPENKSMVRFCEFKLMLCKLKLGKEKEAIAIKDRHDYWDDSPFYYFARAAIFYHSDNSADAEKALRDARYVWKDDNALAPWQDTMIEFGFIRSFYGGDLDVKAVGE